MQMLWMNWLLVVYVFQLYSMIKGYNKLYKAVVVISVNYLEKIMELKIFYSWWWVWFSIDQGKQLLKLIDLMQLQMLQIKL